MTAVIVTVGVAVWFALAAVVGRLLGGAIRNRDRQIPRE